MKKEEPECCPEFQPHLWDDKEFTWENKKFITDNVRTFLFMPINFGAIIRRMMRKVDSADAHVPDWLCLSDHTSSWNMKLIMAVDKEIPGANNLTLSGKFLSKVYEGNFNQTGKWCKDFEKHAKSKNMQVKKLYMWYTTCPKCAKKYGKNYVVIIGLTE